MRRLVQPLALTAPPCWSAYTADELRDIIAHKPIVILPTGAVEQHGPHLAVMVDIRLAVEVTHRAAAAVGDTRPILILPPLWLGLSSHHMAWPGTITLSDNTYRAVLVDICSSLTQHGVRRILIVNGHGGNSRALTQIAADISETSVATVRTLTYWDAAPEEFAATLERQDGVRHACEAETSMMMAAQPDAVRTGMLDRAWHQPTESLLGPNGQMKPFDRLTPNGVIGDARVATRAKGERLLTAAARRIADALVGDGLW